VNLTLTTFLVLSALSVQFSYAENISIPFYKNKESEFSSGSESLFNLNRIRSNTESLNLIEVKKDNLKFKLKAEDVTSDLDLSHVIINTETNQLQYVLNCSEFESCLTRSFEGHVKTYSRSSLENWPGDLGKLVLWRPSLFINATTKIPEFARPGDKFLIVRLQHEYALVMQLTHPFREGYLKLSDGISKLDLAQYVLFKNKWLAVNYKTRDGLYLTNYQKNPVSFSKIKGIITQPRTLVALKEIQTHSLVPRAQMTFLGRESISWSYGHHPEHGFIWWKEQRPKREIFSLEQIKKRKIYSLAHPPKEELPIMISADGIFYSENGKEFIKLESFSNQNWPVAIDPLGYLYVGYQRASPGSLMFYPFIKPADLTRLFPGLSSNFKILDYAFSNGSIRLLAGIGSKRRWIQGAYENPLTSPWTLF